MSKVILTATPCEFTESGFSFELLAKKLAAETVDARNPGQLQSAADALAARVAAENPGREFFVSHMLARGERAFSGYRAMSHRLHDQRCPAAQVQA